MQPPPLPPPLPTASAYANPYAAPVARLEDARDEVLELAGRGTRLVAVIVDSIVFVAPMLVVVLAMSALRGNSSGPPTEDGIFWIALFGPMLAVIVVNMVLLHRYGQTIAKRMFGIKVLRTDGAPCSLLRIIFMRWLPVTLLGAIPLVGYASGLIDALMIFGNEQRCLHDLIADTMVVKA